MGNTRKAQKKAEELRISQIGDFKSRLGGITELPSGYVVRLRNPGGLRAFMTAGVMPNSLMVLIQDSLKKGKGMAPEELMPDGQIDPKMMEDIMNLMDAVAVQCIVEPKLYPRLTEEDVKKHNKAHPTEKVETPEDLRREDRIYADELPDDDKQFIFQWVSGGTRDLEQFRSQLDERMGAVAAVAGNGGNAKPDSGVDAG